MSRIAARASRSNWGAPLKCKARARPLSSGGEAAKAWAQLAQLSLPLPGPVRRAAAGSKARLSLELDGKCSFVIYQDAALEPAVEPARDVALS